jgi:hypothetical protein
VIGLLCGMTLAARDYPPYSSLKGLLATQFFGETDHGAAATVAADAGGATPEEPVAAATEHRIQQVASDPSSRPPLRVTDRSTGEAIRRRLRQFIWGRRGGPPSLPPSSYQRGVKSELERPIPGIVRTDRIVVRQAYGVDSRVELEFPRPPLRGFVIVHGGHVELEDGMYPMLDALARAHYVIAAMNMPLEGWNPKPIVRDPRLGRLVLTTHDLLALLPGQRGGGLLRLFLDPVIATIAQARRMGFEAVDMVGLSGGGWTTTLSAALSEHIRRSYPVAGSLPAYLRSAPPNQGDAEQTVPGFYRIADYQDLYVLAALGSGRRQLQILNDHDPCCFSATSAPTYVRPVELAARAVGGSYALRIVSNSQHSITPAAAALIVRDMSR